MLEAGFPSLIPFLFINLMDTDSVSAEFLSLAFSYVKLFAHKDCGLLFILSITYHICTEDIQYLQSVFNSMKYIEFNWYSVCMVSVRHFIVNTKVSCHGWESRLLQCRFFKVHVSFSGFYPFTSHFNLVCKLNIQPEIPDILDLASQTLLCLKPLSFITHDH